MNPTRICILHLEDSARDAELIHAALQEEGFEVVIAPARTEAEYLSGLLRRDLDLILADYNLPNGLNGLELAAKLRETLHREIPVIVLTGDISAGTLRDIALQECVQLNKPVKVKELTQVIQRLLAVPHSAPAARPQHPAEAATGAGPPVIFVVDDDSHARDAIRTAL